MQQAVNAAPTAGEGARLHRCLSAMVTAGITAGYLTNPRLREVHWQAGNRPAPGPQVSMQGEAAQFVDPSEIPAAADVARLGQALAAGRRGDLHELMANTAAYTGLRQGELFALTAGQIDPAARVIDVDRKVIEVSGTLLTGAPKGRKRRKTIYPARTPQSYPLADKIAARIQAARAEQKAGTNPLGLMFPSPRGTWWRSSNFDRRVLAPAYLAAGWRDPGRQRPLDLAQPAARAVHHRPVHLETRRHRRLGHGRARQRPHHPGHVHRHHRRRPRPRPHSHRMIQPRKPTGFSIKVRRPRRGHMGGPVISTSEHALVKESRRLQHSPASTPICPLNCANTTRSGLPKRRCPLYVRAAGSALPSRRIARILSVKWESAR